MKRSLSITALGAALAGAAFYRAFVRLNNERRSLENVAESLARRNEQLSALSNVFNQIADDMSFEQVVNTSLRETAHIMDADMVSLRRLQGEWLVPVGAMLRDGRSLRLTSKMEVGMGHTGRAVSERRTVRIDRDAELSMNPYLPFNGSQADDTPSPSQQWRGRRQESGIIAPLIVAQRPVGALAVWSTDIGHFTEEDEGVLELMASQVATAMVAASIMEERDRQAHLDSLTGLPNRRQLAEDMAGDLAALAGLNHSAVFAMVDIDNFKEFNDALGHSAGDVLLQSIGTVMRDSIRESDYAYRYGGDEFLVVFRNVSAEEGWQLADRLREAIDQQLSELRRVTVSIGLAALPSNGTEPGRLVEVADIALYAAKHDGRNRIIAWDLAQQQPAA